jgi:hypothetical protein
MKKLRKVVNVVKISNHLGANLNNEIDLTDGMPPSNIEGVSDSKNADGVSDAQIIEGRGSDSKIIKGVSSSKIMERELNPSHQDSKCEFMESV